MGRWTSKDSAFFDGGSNFYEYANNDPVNFFDLDGSIPIAPLLIGCLAGTGAAFIYTWNDYTFEAIAAGFSGGRPAMAQCRANTLPMREIVADFGALMVGGCAVGAVGVALAGPSLILPVIVGAAVGGITTGIVRHIW